MHAVQVQSSVGKQKFDYVGASEWPLTTNLSPCELCALIFEIGGWLS